jgi:hypothetical protein
MLDVLLGSTELLQTLAKKKACVEGVVWWEHQEIFGGKQAVILAQDDRAAKQQPVRAQ